MQRQEVCRDDASSAMLDFLLFLIATHAARAGDDCIFDTRARRRGTRYRSLFRCARNIVQDSWIVCHSAAPWAGTFKHGHRVG
jgi:hypothetical protein